METLKVNRVGFDEIFRYAEKYGVSWNLANNLFFNNIFDYKTIATVECSSLWWIANEYFHLVNPSFEMYGFLKTLSVDDVKALPETDRIKASVICALFMIENNVQEMEVDSR